MQTLEQAEQRRQFLEEKLTQINQEWMSVSENIMIQTSEYMQNQEM